MAARTFKRRGAEARAWSQREARNTIAWACDCLEASPLGTSSACLPLSVAAHRTHEYHGNALLEGYRRRSPRCRTTLLTRTTYVMLSLGYAEFECKVRTRLLQPHEAVMTLHSHSTQGQGHMARCPLTTGAAGPQLLVLGTPSAGETNFEESLSGPCTAPSTPCGTYASSPACRHEPGA